MATTFNLHEAIERVQRKLNDAIAASIPPAHDVWTQWGDWNNSWKNWGDWKQWDDFKEWDMVHNI